MLWLMYHQSLSAMGVSKCIWQGGVHSQALALSAHSTYQGKPYQRNVYKPLSFVRAKHCSNALEPNQRDRSTRRSFNHRPSAEDR